MKQCTLFIYLFLFQLKIQEALKKKERFHREHEEVRIYAVHFLYDICFGEIRIHYNLSLRRIYYTVPPPTVFLSPFFSRFPESPFCLF